MNEIKRICPHCNREMELAVKSYPMGSVFHLNRFHADIYRCPNCMKIELFAVQGDMVPCPVCGTMHPAQEKCVVCALDAAFGGAEAREKLVYKK